MFLKRLFGPRPPSFQFSADLPDDEPARLHEVFDDCLSRKGGTLATDRRTKALAELFSKLSPTGKKRFAGEIEARDDTAVQATLNSYAEIEEAELFGRARDRMAIFDALERPRLRLLSMLAATPDGPHILAEIAGISNGLAEDIEKAMAGLD